MKGGRARRKEQAWKEKALRAPLSDTPGHHPISYETTPGPFDEIYGTPRLFWRGDDRPPEAVFKTGFTSKWERDNRVARGENVLVWRSGNNQDDLHEDSGVSLARDVRGSAFFPLDKDAQYMYAVGLVKAVSTYRMQQLQEEAETGSKKVKAHRYPYDPTESASDEWSPVWQFQEYAAHRVEKHEILLGYRLERKLLIDPGDSSTYSGKYAMAGIKFRLEKVWESPIARSRKFKQVTMEAERVARAYASWYPPGPDEYISFFGTVTARGGLQVTSLEEASEAHDEGFIRQTAPVVGKPVEEIYERKKKRARNRLQKKRKKFRGRKR
ncbi:MAG: hypothetical protein M3444_03950 [Acidobacteriota bacterium]|nr:hypothetical protein [Acidobacteriota bacterium]MDQ5836069.1 hypothetical protein [Acidobacteriota bacterium]